MLTSDILVLVLLAVILILATANSLSLWLWYKDHHALVDKIMSRSYAEYVTSQVYQKSQVVGSPKLPIGETEIEETDVLKELNQQLGL